MSTFFYIIMTAFGDLALAALALTFFGVLTRDERLSQRIINIARIMFGIAITFSSLVYLINLKQLFGIATLLQVVHFVVGILFLMQKKMRIAALTLASVVALNWLLNFLPRITEFPVLTRLHSLSWQAAFIGGLLLWAGIFSKKESKEVRKSLKS